MKVEIEGEKKVEFKEIYDGECFKDVSGELFIKRCNSEEYNATRLYDGEIFAYGIEKLVIPVNAKVVVEKFIPADKPLRRREQISKVIAPQDDLPF